MGTMKTILVSVLMLSAALCFADDIDEDIDSMAADLLNTQETNQCSADTGGTCRVFSCNSSRKASCKNSKCVCGAGSCAIGGKCVATQAPTAHPTVQPTAAPTAHPTVQPTAQPTANPTANPTASPSNQWCKNSKCVCGAGKCAIGGKCVSMTGAPQSGEEDEENFLETKSSSEADSKAQCSNDTGGTCRVMSCNSSRKARCVKSGFLGSTSKCLCRAGSCAIGGKCIVKTASPTSQPTAQPTANPTANPTASPSNQCSKNTGGTCRVFSCNSSRKASCKNSKCVCGAGKCAIGGKCFSMTGAPQSGEEDEENFLETKSSSEADSKAQC